MVKRIKLVLNEHRTAAHAETFGMKIKQTSCRLCSDQASSRFSLSKPARTGGSDTHKSLQDADGLDGVGPLPVQAEDGLHAGSSEPRLCSVPVEL